MTLPRGSLSLTCDVGYVVAEAAVAFDVPEEALTGPGTTQPLVTYRHVAMAAARRLGHSFPIIGRGFDRDHTTVMHAVKRVDASPDLSRRADVLAESVLNRARSLF